MSKTIQKRKVAEGLPWVHKNGVLLCHGEHNSFGIDAGGVVLNGHIGPLKVEVDHRGKRLKEDHFDPKVLYRDRLAVDIRECMIRAMDGTTVLAQLGSQPQGHLYQPWMVWQGDQAYITESYVSIPPALRIVDETGALWTLGFETAPKELSPEGEFAFNVIRDGIDVHEIASRIERRNGKVRIFTRHGWKVWNPIGQYFA